jgi:16S rRNA (cytosine967-C5)-methyltransferase
MASLGPRDLALEALVHFEESSFFPEAHLKRAFQNNPLLSQRDRAFAMNLVQGVLRWRRRLDWILAAHSHTPLGKIEPLVLNVLRLALYQIYFMDRVPDSASVNEAVRQAGKQRLRYLGNFVNGVLRSVCRSKGQESFPDPGQDPVLYLSVYYSYPEWLVRKWIKELGRPASEQLLAAGNQIPALVLRTNTLKTTRSQLIESLQDEGATARPTAFSPEGVALMDFRGSVNRLRSFQRGLFQVQGEAAQICSHLLGAQPGNAVLDLCAGLGGKSTHLAALMQDQGSVLALDKAPGRLQSLAEASRRLALHSIKPVAADAGGPLAALMRVKFDRIMVDAPCSSLGTLSKHPGAKWKRRQSDPKRLSLLQAHILAAAVPLLAEGGRMLYANCTISKEESEEVVEDFLGQEDQMVLENLNGYVPEWCLNLIDAQGFLRTLPHRHGMEGFFGALFVKKRR